MDIAFVTLTLAVPAFGVLLALIVVVMINDPPPVPPKEKIIIAILAVLMVSLAGFACWYLQP